MTRQMGRFMSATKNQITEEDYLIDLQSILDIVDLSEDAIEL